VVGVDVIAVLGVERLVIRRGALDAVDLAVRIGNHLVVVGGPRLENGRVDGLDDGLRRENLPHQQHARDSGPHVVGIELVAGQADAGRVVADADAEPAIAHGDDLGLAVDPVVNDRDAFLGGRVRVVVVRDQDVAVPGDVIGGDEVRTAARVAVVGVTDLFADGREQIAELQFRGVRGPLDLGHILGDVLLRVLEKELRLGPHPLPVLLLLHRPHVSHQIGLQLRTELKAGLVVAALDPNDPNFL
jgi:hypothetical protein